MTKHIILFLAANPVGTDRLALDEEARAIQVALERSGRRDKFELVTRWAARPMDLLDELRKLRPTVVHFSGHGGRGALRKGAGARRDIGGAIPEAGDGESLVSGLFFQGPDGRPQLVSTPALEETFGAAGSSAKVVVLNACYSKLQAEALVAHVDCVVGMPGAIRDNTAQSFAVGFYGGIAERESVAAAFKQGCAAVSLNGGCGGKLAHLMVRNGVNANSLTLAAQSKNIPCVNDNLLSFHFDSFDSGLQDVLALAAAEARRNNKQRISTHHMFSAMVRLQPGHMRELIRCIRQIAPTALPAASHATKPDRDLLLKPFPVSSCIQHSVENLTPRIIGEQRLTSEDLFVDVARYGTGESVRRLRTHGIDSESIYRVVKQLGWQVISRR